MIRNLALAAAAAAAFLPIYAARAEAAEPAAAKTYTVTIDKMAFGATPTGLRVGDVIEWVNADLYPHSATANDGAFDVNLLPKARGRTVVGKVGEVSFYCRYHPSMTGKLLVGN